MGISDKWLWEEDTDALCSCPFPSTAEAILQATSYAPVHLDILFYFNTVKLLAVYAGLINELNLLTLRFKPNSEFSADWLLLRGQDDWFNYALQQLIYPKCLMLCDSCNELTLQLLLLALCRAVCIHVTKQKYLFPSSWKKTIGCNLFSLRIKVTELNCNQQHSRLISDVVIQTEKVPS